MIFVKVRKLFLLFLSLSLFAHLALAEPTFQSPVSLGLSASGSNFLWKAKGNNNTVYIFGSLHLAKPELYPLDEEIENAFESSEVLAVEVDIGKQNPFELQQKFFEKGMYYGSDTIADHLSEETFKLAKEKLASLGMDISYMIMHKPWFLAINLVTLELVKLGFDPNYGIDKYFMDKARGNKDIVELETIDFQINLFDSFNDNQQELLLFSTLLDIDIIEQEMEKMISFWQSGDAKGLEEVLRKGLDEYPQVLPIYEKLFYERNKTMTEKIETFLAGGKDYFVVVGAGHLVGKEGIIQLLKEKGYSLQQL